MAELARSSHRRGGGGSKPGERRGGRRKGTPNRATANAKEAIARFVDGNSKRLQRWLDKIAKEEGPKAAFQCFTDLLEYHVPKLARTEVVGDADRPIATTVKHVYEGLPTP